MMLQGQNKEFDKRDLPQSAVFKLTGKKPGSVYIIESAQEEFGPDKRLRRTMGTGYRVRFRNFRYMCWNSGALRISREHPLHRARCLGGLHSPRPAGFWQALG